MPFEFDPEDFAEVLADARSQLPVTILSEPVPYTDSELAVRYLIRLKVQSSTLLAVNAARDKYVPGLTRTKTRTKLLEIGLRHAEELRRKEDN